MTPKPKKHESGYPGLSGRNGAKINEEICYQDSAKPKKHKQRFEHISIVVKLSESRLPLEIQIYKRIGWEIEKIKKRKSGFHTLFFKRPV